MRTRVWYALRFLDSQELKRWGRKCTERAAKEGDLEGLIFTGASDRGVEIMQSYLDRTSDIQTVASIVGRCIMEGGGGDKREEWMEGYREWLNKGRMFKLRAKVRQSEGRSNGWAEGRDETTA